MQEEIKENLTAMDNVSLVREMVRLTDILIEERTNQIGAQEDFANAKEILAQHEAFMMRDIAAAMDGDGRKSFANGESRAAELIVRQNNDDKDGSTYKKLLKQRNDAWHQMKLQEAIIEHTQNELENIRLVMRL